MLQWKENPLSFFKEAKSELVLTSNPLVQMHTYMTGLNAKNGLGGIRMRLLQVVYYRLKEETRRTGEMRLRGNSRHKVNPRELQFSYSSADWIYDVDADVPDANRLARCLSSSNPLTAFAEAFDRTYLKLTQ